MRSSIVEQEVLQIPTETDIIDTEDYLFKKRFEDDVKAECDTVRVLGRDAIEYLVTCQLPEGAPIIRSGISSEVIGSSLGQFASGSRDAQRLDNLYHQYVSPRYEVALEYTPMHLNLGEKAVETTLPLVTFTKKH